jgi:transposase-like protein
MNKPNEARRRRWRKLVEEQASSGESVVGFCERRGLRRQQLFWWRRRLQEGGDGPAGFLEVKLPRAAPELELRLTGGRLLVLRPGVDLDWVREVAAALEGRD